MADDEGDELWAEVMAALAGVEDQAGLYRLAGRLLVGVATQPGGDWATAAAATVLERVAGELHVELEGDALRGALVALVTSIALAEGGDTSGLWPGAVMATAAAVGGRLQRDGA